MQDHGADERLRLMAHQGSHGSILQPYHVLPTVVPSRGTKRATVDIAESARSLLSYKMSVDLVFYTLLKPVRSTAVSLLSHRFDA